MPGGFRRCVLDDPGRLTLWANRQGGFGVRCPRTGQPVVEAFSAAWAEARRTDDEGVRVPCPACGGEHALSDLRFRPEAAFGRWALVVAEVDAPALADGAPARWPALSGMVTVLRRG